MKGVVFEPSVPRFVAGRLLGTRSPFDAAAAARLRDVPEPDLPGPEWVRLEVVLAGVCGSDTAMLLHKVCPDLSALSSFPAVMGHEVLGRVVEAGRAVTRFRIGDRVVVDPFLGCRVRGMEPLCRSCVRGFPCVCENTTDGRFAAGLILGTCRDLPGSWSERILAHESQVHRVAEVDDAVAALSEPLAIGLHAVLLAPPAEGGRALIIGGGPVAFAVLLALRMLGLKLDVTLVTELEYQRDLALELGADRAFPTGPGTDEALARLSGTRFHSGILGRPYPSGGFEIVYDCVGAPSTVMQALRWTREKGTLLLAGNASRADGLDLALIWAKEIRFQGTLGYGMDELRGETRHTFDWLGQLLPAQAGKAAKLVSHTFSLDEHRQAVAAATDRRGHRSVKVLMRPRPAE